MPLILPGNVASATAVAGYDVANSCRFNDGDSAYMHKTPSSGGSATTWTYSVWVKRSTIGTSQRIMSNGNQDGAGTYDTQIQFRTDDKINFDVYTNGVTTGNYFSNRVFRDVGAWYHFVFVWNTTSGTSSLNGSTSDRMQLWVNGVQESSFSGHTSSSPVIPSQNAEDLGSNSTSYAMRFGTRASSLYFDGYLAEVCWIDGSALTASSFGEFDEDSPTIWKPKDVSGLTFGTNGFYCDFEDSSNLGNDVNGGTDLTEVNLAAADQATDTPTNNFCTLNSIATTNSIGDDLTFSEGNCKITNTSDGAWHPAIGTMAVNAGKWYCEFKCTTIGGASKYAVLDVDQYIERVNFADSSRGYSYEYYSGAAVNNSNWTDNWGDTFTTGDIISVAMDLTNMKLYFAKNGTWQDSGDPTSGATGTGTHTYFGGGSNSARAAGIDYYAFAVGIHNSSVTEANFGGCPAFTVSSGNADGNGYGNFEYAPPSGYLALCTKNLGSDGG